MIDWKTLDSIEAVREIQESSYTKPQLIFKHSTTCPISSIGLSRIQDDWKWGDAIDTHFLDLLQYRSVSNHVAEFLDVHHESPQVILLHKGEVIHDTSHLDISIADLEDVLAFHKIR